MGKTPGIGPETTAEKKGHIPNEWTNWEEEQLRKQKAKEGIAKDGVEWEKEQNSANEVLQEKRPEDIGKDTWKPGTRPIEKTLPTND